MNGDTRATISRRAVLKGTAATAGTVLLGGLPATQASAEVGPVAHTWVGAVTASSAWVRSRVTGSSVRLAVADNPRLVGAAHYGPVSPTTDSIASITATDLESNARYWYALEVDGHLDRTTTGRFATHPPLGAPASFSFAAASCAGARDEDRVSNSPVFETILSHHPQSLFFAHMGDLHYRDIGSGRFVEGHAIERFREAYDDVLAHPRQHALYRNMPIEYMWDDHDFGPNNADETSPGRENAALAYRERVPHYPLPAGDGAQPVYHHFQVGRVLFVATDLRFDRDPNRDPDSPTKTMLGVTQKAWLDSLLGSSDAETLVWINTAQWMGTSTDSWWLFAHERDELVQMFGDHGWLDRMLQISGDKHTLAIDTGGGNEWGGFPVFLFASLDCNWDEIPEEQYDTGPTSPGNNRYGTISVTDTGRAIRIVGTGWIGSRPWRTHRFTVTPRA